MMHSRTSGPRGAGRDVAVLGARARRVGALALSVVLLGIAAGCGQSGPLSLPEQKTAAAAGGASSAPVASQASIVVRVPELAGTLRRARIGGAG